MADLSLTPLLSASALDQRDSKPLERRYADESARRPGYRPLKMRRVTRTPPILGHRAQPGVLRCAAVAKGRNRKAAPQSQPAYRTGA